MNYRDSKWMGFWSLACVVGFGGLVSCGSEEEPAPPAATTVQDASVDVVQDAVTPLTDAQKAAGCKPDASDSIGLCACATCPSQTYDCYYAGTEGARQCKLIIDCALQTGCTDMTSCMAACGTVILANAQGATLATGLQACVMRCVPETGPSGEAGPDAPSEAAPPDAPTEAAPADAPADTAAPDSAGDATTD